MSADPLSLYGCARPGLGSDPQNHPATGAHAEGGGSGPLPNVQGMAEGSPPLCAPQAGFAAVLSTVPKDEFCGPAAEANLQDLEWLGPRAFRHLAVVEQVLGLGPVLPARFGTRFSSLAAVQEYAALNAAAIRQFLELVANREEWGARAASPEARPKPPAWRAWKDKVNRRRPRAHAICRRSASAGKSSRSWPPGWRRRA